MKLIIQNVASQPISVRLHNGTCMHVLIQVQASGITRQAATLFVQPTGTKRKGPLSEGVRAYLFLRTRHLNFDLIIRALE